MHRFLWRPANDAQPPPELIGAYLVGQDNVPVRGEIQWSGGELRCQPRTQDPIGVSLLWPCDGFGLIQLQTTRLPARDAPYHLHIELARHQLMRLSIKREEWGLFDYNGMEDLAAEIDRAKDEFVAALELTEDSAKSARHADAAIVMGLRAGERMARFHAEIFLARRQQSGGFSKPFLGVCAPATADPAVQRRVADLGHYVRVPSVWRDIQPNERAQQYDAMDAAVKSFSALGLALRGGPLLNFGVQAVPDWMYIWENDFEAIYEAAREHVERTVKRHTRQVSSWIAVSGLHADNAFGFTFEQVMELTRMATSVIKQIAPRAPVLVDLTQPWGEYYARNHQTTPPLLYADMVVQSGVNFDAFGLQLVSGIGSDGFHVRDLLQLSALIDKLANFGKPIQITALAAPSSAASGGSAAAGGEWGGPWTEERQAEWLTSACEIALSKPYVETVCVGPLLDSPDAAIPGAGLMRADGTPKLAFNRLVEMRRRLAGGGAK